MSQSNESQYIEGATWLYRICNTCKLRFEADKPACPRCGNNAPGKAHPGGEFAGFLARRDESPILDEEERYVTRNLVKTYPQWDGQVLGRWTLSNGWGLRWSQDEEVRWVNEGVAPKDKDREQGIPLLHDEAKGYMLCADCGKMLQNPDLIQPTSGRRKTRQTGEDPYGHAENCSQKGKAPQPLAIVTAGKAEILRLTIPVPTSIDEEDLQSWGLSLGYALKAGMQHLYMLDGSEIDFEYEAPWLVNSNGKKYNMISLTFIDPSLGGSGYLRRIATELHQVAKRAIEHLDHPNCETACYRCLKFYQNQRYHELLNYPQIMSALEQLSHTPPIQQPLETGDIKDPLPWLEAYAVGVGSPLELKFLRLFEQYNFHPQKQVPIPQEAPISIADFAVSSHRLAIYIDGAAFHTGGNRLRDKFIRDRLRGANPSWQVVVLYAADLARGKALVEELKHIIK